jgi:hypothetical protein
MYKLYITKKKKKKKKTNKLKKTHRNEIFIRFIKTLWLNNIDTI